MKKLIATILLPALVVAVAAIGFYWWDHGAPPGFRPKLVEVRPGEISYDNRGVTLVGTANYQVRLIQRSTDGSRTWWLFPVMEMGDTTGNYVRVLVRTTHEPDELLGFEDVRVDGLARPPGALIGPDVRRELIASGFELDEKLVLVEAFDD
ncbi:MAG: hypothetical protein GXP62_11250 [Oligoflexia bacterium]|nr:hypothetical protein [Oligoflexia bacterium]